MHYEIVETISHREVEGQILLISPTDDELYTLNGVGRLVWLSLVDGMPPPEIAAHIAQTYGIDLEQAAADVGQFIDALVEHGFIKPADHE